MRGLRRADSLLSKPRGGVWPRFLTLAALVCALTAALLAAAAPAGADVFGPISLLSTSSVEQFEYAHDPAVSGDGRYVVFDGSIGGVSGVWRRENGPGGSLEQVAGGNAELPSVSSNGQFVSFTTDEGTKLEEDTDGQPVAHPVHGIPNVYVRNMDVAPGHGAFTLASHLEYEYPAAERAFDEENYGAEAAGRNAISANGEKIVFVTTAASNLGGHPGTPPLEVGLHDMKTGATELVSVKYDPATGKPAIDPETGDPEPVPYEEYGAVYTVAGKAPIYEAPYPFWMPLAVGASISADGSTVAWMGQQITEQAPILPDESLQPRYSEPLWRRIADGPEAPTRRVTGGSDPANPACAAHPEETLVLPPVASDPCQGPFTLAEGYGIWHGENVNDTVQLSANGETVAFLATASLVSQGEDFGSGASTRPADLYVSSMREGISRDQALTQLTEVAGAEAKIAATDAPILDFGISPEGSQVAFTTKRTVFPLGSPAFVSTPAAVPGMAELFDVDLAQDTVTRVTHGYRGEASERPHEERPSAEDEYSISNDGAMSPSFSDNGEVLTFSSTAGNLVFGDGNTPALASELDGSDVFSVDRIVFNSIPTPQAISAAPPGPPLTPQWQLGTTALSLGDGNVLLYVQAPGAGTLSAFASSPVRTGSTGSSRAARRARRRHARARAAATVHKRTVASAAARIAASGGGLTTLLLTLGPRYRALAAQPGGLSATANLTFAAAGYPALHESVAVSFARAAPRKPAPRSPAAARARSGAGRRVRR